MIINVFLVFYFNMFNNVFIFFLDFNLFSGVGDWGVDGEEGLYRIIRCNVLDFFLYCIIKWMKEGNLLFS